MSTNTDTEETSIRGEGRPGSRICPSRLCTASCNFFTWYRSIIDCFCASLSV